MLIFNTKETLSTHLKPILNKGESIGFIPTMGALHIGHISLVKRSLLENKHTIVSVFVNPTQFNNAGDLENYPRTLEKDKALLNETSGEIIIFSPSAENLYNGNITSLKFNFGAIESVMEGKFRPGHFDGVGTVLTHLFDAVQPTRAYFGEKDFQQLQVVRKLVEINKSNIEIIGCDIYREPNGLAYSSRNKRLSDEVKNKANIIYQTLNEAKKMFGTNNVTGIKEYVTSAFKNNYHFKLEYFEIANTETLQLELPIVPTTKYRAFIAVFAEQNVRLIDNIALN